MIKFSHARTALKYGLISRNIGENNEILVPSYNCEAALMPIKELKIKYKFYDVGIDLLPNWKNLKSLISDETCAILMVNYFGQPQKIENFQNFCDENKLILIEDNAHGHGGTYKNKELGKFGDIGISAPRKIINLYSGGFLYSKKKLEIDMSSIPPYPISKTYLKIRDFFNNKPQLKKNIKKLLLKKRPKYEDPYFFKTPKINDYKIDEHSDILINNTDWNNTKLLRQKNYDLWHKFSLENKLKPVFSNLNEGSIPWCFPAFVENHEEAIRWFLWGWNKNLFIFSWPTLPSLLIHEDSQSYNLWKKIICFSTDSFINEK